MAPGPAAAADWVINCLPRAHPPTDPESLIVQIGEELGWFQSPEEAQEKAELWRKRFLNRLRLAINDPERRGRPTRFEFNSVEEEAIQGACFVEPGDSDDLRASKGRRVYIDEYLALIRGLTGRQFEGVCRGLLALIGCEAPILTPRGNDQGIDFHGRLEMRGRLNMAYVQPAFDEALHAWIIGQAKQVAGNVGTPEIRDLIGSVEIALRGISADEGRALTGLEMRPFDSVWRFFVTTGDFSRDALKLINASGLMGIDGLSVAAILADHAVVNGTHGVDPALFDAWVDAQLPAAG